MTRFISTPDENLYESARDVLTAALLAICSIRDIPFVTDDAELIAETLLDQIELADIHALAYNRSPAILGKLLRQGNVCFSKLLENGQIDPKRLSKTRLRRCAIAAAVEVGDGA